MRHGQYWAVWTLDGAAVCPMGLHVAELFILILDSFCQAACFAVVSERPCTGLIFNSGSMLQGVRFAADGEASAVPLPRVESPNMPSCKGVVTRGTCHPGITRWLEALRKHCPWHGQASTAFWSRLKTRRS